MKRVAFEMKRVLFADDSSLMRKLVFQTLKEGGFEVILASDGKEAVEKALNERPDAAVLDIRMPKMDGISALREIAPLGIPVVMFSSLTREDSQVTMDALEAGAFDFVLKPGGIVTLDISEVKGELLRKVKAAIVSKRIPLVRRVAIGPKEKCTSASPANAALLVAASTGGPSFVRDLVQSLDGGGRYAVLIVQHMPPVFTKFFAERISSSSRIPVREASNGEPILEGVAYLAPGDYHMEVSMDPNPRIILHQGPKINYVRPSADPLFISAARRFGRKTVAVILTGIGSDGTNGAIAVKANGGTVIAQDEKTSVVYGMPKNVAESGSADFILPFDEIPDRINEIFAKIF